MSATLKYHRLTLKWLHLVVVTWVNLTASADSITNDSFWKEIRYGWRCPTNMALTNDTIFANTNKQQITIEDMIEISIGTWERAQAAANSADTGPSYPVFTYTNFIFELIYTSNSVVTNSISRTNYIAWIIDKQILLLPAYRTIDETITNMIPHFVNTNIYDGATNWQTLTITGLWASLGIGDRTNQFTQMPSVGTNSATYGGMLSNYFYRIYLEERYKILNALKTVRYNISYSGGFAGDAATRERNIDGDGVYTQLIASWPSASINSPYALGTVVEMYINRNSAATSFEIDKTDMFLTNIFVPGVVSSATDTNVLIYLHAINPIGAGSISVTNTQFYDPDFGSFLGKLWFQTNIVDATSTNNGSFLVVGKAGPDTNNVPPEAQFESHTQKGYTLEPVCFAEYTFYYCTNRFWE